MFGHKAEDGLNTFIVVLYNNWINTHIFSVNEGNFAYLICNVVSRMQYVKVVVSVGGLSFFRGSWRFVLFFSIVFSSFVVYLAIETHNI
jgi:hypothetical protein